MSGIKGQKWGVTHTQKEYDARYYEKNRERIIKRNKKYSEENREKVKERQQKWYQANKDKERIRKANWYRLKRIEELKPAKSLISTNERKYE